MTKDGLGLYSALSRAPFPKSFPGKVLFSAFLGTHVPMVALVVYLVLSSPIAKEFMRTAAREIARGVFRVGRR